MRLVVALAGSLLGAVPASAQYYEAPRPPAAIGPAVGNSDSAAEIVEAMGLEPIGPAVRSGAFLVQRARDDFGRVLRVTVDARRSQVMAVEPIAPRGTYAARGAYPGYQPYGPYAGYGPNRGPYAMRAPAALDAPGSLTGAREPHAAQSQPHSASIVPDLPLPPTPSAKPKAKSAAVTPQRPSTPRKRPAAAPQQAAGTIEPVAPPAVPQGAAPAAAPVVPAPQPQNAMPPVTPLE